MIASNKQLGDDEFEGMLQDWPDERIARPPAFHQDAESSLFGDSETGLLTEPEVATGGSPLGKRKRSSVDSSTESWCTAPTSLKKHNKSQGSSPRPRQSRGTLENAATDSRQTAITPSETQYPRDRSNVRQEKDKLTADQVVDAASDEAEESAVLQCRVS